MAKNTYARRNFNNGAVRVMKGDDLSNLPANQLRDFQMVGLAGEKPVEEAPVAGPGKA